jgi:hypothetical protein
LAYVTGVGTNLHARNWSPCGVHLHIYLVFVAKYWCNAVTSESPDCGGALGLGLVNRGALYEELLPWV